MAITTPVPKTSALTPISSGPEAVDPGTSQRHEGPDGLGISAAASEVSAEQARNTIAAIVFFCITMSPRMKTYDTKWESNHRAESESIDSPGALRYLLFSFESSYCGCGPKPTAIPKFGQYRVPAIG